MYRTSSLITTLPHGAVHRFLEGDLAVAVAVVFAVVPDDGRVRIRPGEIALRFDYRLQPLVRNRLLGIRRIERQFGADVAAVEVLRRIDAPQVPDAFAVLRIFADGDVDQSVVDHRRADEMVSRGPAAHCVKRRFGVGVELPQQLGVALAVAFGGEAVEPAVAAGKQHLRHAAQHAVRWRRPLAVQDIQAGRFVGPENLLACSCPSRRSWAHPAAGM